MPRLLVAASALALGASVAPVVLADSPAPTHGLKTQFFNNEDFTGDSVEVLDPNIDYRWEGVPPVDGIDAHTFSIRWTGTITPRYSEHYTFSTRSDDGIRVTIGGQTIIDNWTTHAVTTDTGEIDLEAGQAYPITVEFYEHLGRAEVSLSWQSASQAAEIVPQERLAPPADWTPPTDTTTTGTGTTPTTTTDTGTTSTPVATTPARTETTPAATTGDTPAAPQEDASIPEADFPPPSTPIAGQTFNAEPVRGEVLVRTNQGVRRLGGARTLPIGIRLDTRHGAVKINTAKARGVKHPKQYARISGGTFKVAQPSGGERVVTLDMTHGDFEDCAPQSPATRGKARAAARKTGSDKVRSLWGHGKGRFRTVGRNAAATVRGTFWNVEDTCDSTIVRVREGVVDVEDFKTGKTVTLLAGDSYTAWLTDRR